jgi:CRISPR/Cas system endoribonuclease Cas6 (RAMP superfamily)
MGRDHLVPPLAPTGGDRRIRVHLRAPPPVILPLNHAYPLASLICRLIERSSSEYAAFLHGRGYGDGDHRCKLSTFLGDRPAKEGNPTESYGNSARLRNSTLLCA